VNLTQITNNSSVNIYLRMGGIVSNEAISTSSTVKEIESVLHDMFKVNCDFSYTGLLVLWMQLRRRRFHIEISSFLLLLFSSGELLF